MSLDEPAHENQSSERKYQVFISSTFSDLAKQRRIVLDVIVDNGHMPIALERFAAEDNTVPTVIQRTIEASQIYIVILGYRYGEIVKGRGISFSHLEYEIASVSQRIVVPFVLNDEEVSALRCKLRSDFESDCIQLKKLAPGTPDHNELKKKVTRLRRELGNEKRLANFRSIVKKNKFYKPFSFEEGGVIEHFDGRMVLAALHRAEKDAVKRRIPGWIREPADKTLSELLDAVSHNRFLVDVVGAMAKFDSLVPRVRDDASEKEAAASFFADKYLQAFLSKHTALGQERATERNGSGNPASLFFESGSTVAYVANVVGSRLRELRDPVRISTNNVLAYLIFWLVHRVQCSLFPWGPPEQLYGAVFGPINDKVPFAKTPSFPPEPLNRDDREAIEMLLNDYYSPAKWTTPALMLCALSGLQLIKDPAISDCLGPHVGSPRNKVFKRFMYQTGLPMMLFLTEKKINSDVDKKKCHFILEQEPGETALCLSWESFLKNRAVAFCVGSENLPARVKAATVAFEDLGLKIIRADHKTSHTAFIARNQKFIDEFESLIGLT
jgi:hypothetical protein